MTPVEAAGAVYLGTAAIIFLVTEFVLMFLLDVATLAKDLKILKLNIAKSYLVYYVTKYHKTSSAKVQSEVSIERASVTPGGDSHGTDVVISAVASSAGQSPPVATEKLEEDGFSVGTTSLSVSGTSGSAPVIEEMCLPGAPVFEEPSCSLTGTSPPVHSPTSVNVSLDET